MGLAPLDESNWSKGKCAFKLLQYSAAGVPSISSNVGVNRELINHYKNGILIRKNSDWEKSIIKLQSDKHLYQTMRKNSLILAKDYDFKHNYQVIKNLINNEL